jgi:uncharacterized protein YgiM (DUF1202 family)
VRQTVLCTAIIASLAIWPSVAPAENGPDKWDVTGVASNDALNLRSQPSPSGSLIVKIPHDAKGLQNFGCRGGPSLAQFQRMSQAERTATANRRWCQVSYSGKKGWVSARFLKESAE